MKNDVVASEEQAALIKQGSDVWNSWRNKYFDTRIDLSHTDLSNAYLRGVDLSNAYLVGTNFCDADLQQSDLSYAKLGGAKLRNADLMDARLRKARLCKADLKSAYLVSAELYGADLRNADLSFATLSIANLYKANLSRANLRNAKCLSADLRKTILCNADLNNANLCEANLRSANLRSANLSEAQVLRTNFKYANLNGACIQDWQIGSSTILEEVRCDYIFRTYDVEGKRFSGRLPVDPESTFSPGEFTQRFQIIASALETIDITFTEGIDWQAFFQSFQELKQRYPDKNIAVQGMEEKGDAFVVRLKVDVEETGPELEKLKADIETAEKRSYSAQLALREAQGELRVYREMMGVVKTMAEKTMGDQNFYGPVGNVAQTNQGNMQNVQHIYAPDQQDLSEAAKEIQALLNTLAETYNTTTDAGKENLMKNLGQKIKQHPKWRRALKVGGIELIKVLCGPIGIPLEMARVYLEDE